jgi:hypothetical protein
MNNKISYLILAIALTIQSNSYCGPSFTGPLLAPAGHTIPAGHTNLEVYGFFTNLIGFYTIYGSVDETPHRRNLIFNPIFTHGLTSKLDFQFSAPFNYNRNMNERSRRFGDASTALGFQLLEQKGSTWRPDLRLSILEVIPTGRFDTLDPINNGTDATGLGSYQTAINLNFQHLHPFSETIYLRTRLSLGYVYAAPVDINGSSVYGGNITTFGTVNPGNQVSVDLAFELALNEHWVAVLETFAAKRNASIFFGSPGLDAEGLPNLVGLPLSKQLTFAPAIEYNFTPTIGLIGGVWFTGRGRSTSQFASAVIALNMYW